MELRAVRSAVAGCYDGDSVECLDDNAASEFVSGATSKPQTTRIEQHLANCRDCRALVAALAQAGDVDSQAQTHQRERITESQAGRLPRALQIGDRVGRYLVLSTLGAGGMGVVFAAYDPQLDRKVALKLLRANLGANAKEARKRLKREAQAIAQLSHPNVVNVYDVGTTDDGDVYIAMEFVEGDTVSVWLKRWPRTWREVLDVFHQAGRGLQAAHGVGLLHRDFKPDNVLVGGDGRVRVTDFGLARSVLGPDDAATRSLEGRAHNDTGSALHAELTATGTVLGTPRYMPPEQLTGPDIDARSDQFSFCVALYEALYGTHPLPGSTSVAMLEHGEQALPPPEGTRVPAPIARAVLRGLAKERSKRFPTMAALMSELEPPPQRSPMRLFAFAAMAVVLVGGATAAIVTRPDPPQIPVTNDEQAVRPLLDEIQQLRAERAKLEKQLNDLLQQHQTTTHDLENVKQQLVELNDEYNRALDEVTRLRAARGAAVATATPKLVPVTNAQVAAALENELHNLEGCFDEWSDRQGSVAIGSMARPRPKEAQLWVTLQITPDGKGLEPTAKGERDLERDGTLTDSHGVLSFCVESAVGRASYPKGSDLLDVEVQVVWAAPGMVNTSARIVGHHAAAAAGDLQ